MSWNSSHGHFTHGPHSYGVALMKFWISLIISLLVLSCKTDPTNSMSDDKSALEPDTARFESCVALRGNAHYLFAHFGSLARIVEHYGPPQALSGGSSSTVTMFVYESILKNPYIVELPDGDERKQRIALLLKTFVGFLDAVVSGKEAVAIRTLVPLYHKASDEGIFALGVGDYRRAAQSMLDLFKSPDFSDLVSPTIKSMLINRDRLGYASYKNKVQEVKKALAALAAFRAEDQDIFFREGLVNFDRLTEVFARMGQFYAGYAPVDGAAMREFLQVCGGREIYGKTWREIADLLIAGKTCGDRYQSLFRSFSQAYIGREANFPSRVDEGLGLTTPSIVSTSIIDGKADVAAYNQSLKNYRANQEPNFNLPFSAIRFGYWIPESIAATTAVGMTKFKDLKSQKFFPLGTTTWRQALMISPAEPGLSRGVEFVPDERLSLGGWSDLAPVQVLKAAGCRRVIYVTREAVETPYITQTAPLSTGRPRTGVAELLGMTEEERFQIYDLANPESSFSQAIKQSEAVWCTDWNRFTDTQLEEIFNEAYDSRILTQDPFFTAGNRSYGRRVAPPIVGCGS